MGFPGGSDGKETACNTGNLGSISGSGRSLGERNGNPFQYSYLENSMDRGAWWATAHGVTKSQTHWPTNTTNIETHTYICIYICMYVCLLLFKNVILHPHFIMCEYQILTLFNHSTTNRNSLTSHIFCTTNSDATKIHVPVFLHTDAFVFLGYFPTAGCLGQRIFLI